MFIPIVLKNKEINTQTISLKVYLTFFFTPICSQIKMKYKYIILTALPLYIVLYTFVFTATYVQQIGRVATTVVFSVATLICFIWTIIQSGANKTLDPLINCTFNEGTDNVITGGINLNINRKYTKNEVIWSRKEAAVMSIYLPIFLSWLVILIVTFTEEYDFRYFEYVSLFINYSVAFYFSMVYAYVIRKWF